MKGATFAQNGKCLPSVPGGNAGSFRLIFAGMTYVHQEMKNAVVLAGTAVALALLPLFLFVYLDATFEPDPRNEYAGLSVFGVPLLVGFVSAPLTVLMGVGAWFLARRRSIGRRLPRVIAGIAIALGILEMLAVLVVV